MRHAARPMLTPQSAQRWRLPPVQKGLGAFLPRTLAFHSEKTFPMNLNCFWTTLARGWVECSGRFHCIKYFNSEVRRRGLASGAAAGKTILTLPAQLKWLWQKCTGCSPRLPEDAWTEIKVDGGALTQKKMFWKMFPVMFLSARSVESDVVWTPNLNQTDQTGLKWHEGEQMGTEFSFLVKLCL